jgi:RimJ/RimL family protein N-acetyltransferase
MDVALRPVVDTDLEEFFAQEQDPEATRRSQFPARDHDRFMTHWRTRILGDPTVLVRTATVDGAIAGSLVSWTEEERRVVGYWFAREYWGQGVGTRALTLFLELERVRPLYADPFAGNVGSVRLLERCGFRRAGTVRYGENEHILLVLDASEPG